MTAENGTQEVQNTVSPSVETPSVTATEVAPVPAPEPAHTSDQSLLSIDATPEESAPKEVPPEPVQEARDAEAKTPEAEKAAEGTENKETQENKDSSQSDEPASLPTYEDFKLPENFSMDAETLSDVTKVLGEFETKTKADHAEVQALGQAMIDRHINALNKSIEHLVATHNEAHHAKVNAWKESIDKDPELGGNRKDTVLNAARRAISMYGGSEEQQADFKKALNESGLGNHPTMVRILSAQVRAVEEGKLLPGMKPVQENRSKIDKRYGSSS